MRITKQTLKSTPASQTQIPVAAVQLNETASIPDKIVVEYYCRGMYRLFKSPRNLFHGAGLAVDTASSGQEALDLCTTGDYGVIIWISVLPDMQGHEAAQQICQQEKAAGKPLRQLLL